MIYNFFVIKCTDLHLLSLRSICVASGDGPQLDSVSLSFVSFLTAGSEISEFISLCIRLLSLLTPVLPAVQPGVSSRTRQWINQMQTGHEGRSASVIQLMCSYIHATIAYIYHRSLPSKALWQQFCLKRTLFVHKSVLPLFRGLTSIERHVKRCQISVNVPSDRVIIQFFCRHGRK